MPSERHTDRPAATPRWLAATIRATADAQPALPFQRGNKHRPASLTDAPAPRPASIAAR
jgi:hypothetical protein